MSVWVHLLLSLHAAPLALLGFEHAPVAELHVPTSWHWSEAVQVTEPPALHAPATQVSVGVHLSPSSHDAPSVFLGLEQAPVEVSQLPASWHWSEAGHVTALPLVQEPAWQVSDFVHLLPSSQLVPLVTLAQVAVQHAAEPAIAGSHSSPASKTPLLQ